MRSRGGKEGEGGSQGTKIASCSGAGEKKDLPTDSERRLGGSERTAATYFRVINPRSPLPSSSAAGNTAKTILGKRGKSQAEAQHKGRGKSRTVRAYSI